MLLSIAGLCKTIPGALHWVGAICLSCCDSCQLNAVADKKTEMRTPTEMSLGLLSNWCFCFWLRLWCKTSRTSRGTCDNKPEKDFSWIKKKEIWILLVHLCKVSVNRNRSEKNKNNSVFTFYPLLPPSTPSWPYLWGYLVGEERRRRPLPLHKAALAGRRLPLRRRMITREGCVSHRPPECRLDPSAALLLHPLCTS